MRFFNKEFIYLSHATLISNNIHVVSGTKYICIAYWVYCDIWRIYGLRPYGGVSAAFWATLRGVTLYVVMTAHEY